MGEETSSGEEVSEPTVLGEEIVLVEGAMLVERRVATTVYQRQTRVHAVDGPGVLVGTIHDRKRLALASRPAMARSDWEAMKRAVDAAWKHEEGPPKATVSEPQAPAVRIGIVIPELTMCHEPPLALWGSVEAGRFGLEVRTGGIGLELATTAVHHREAVFSLTMVFTPAKARELGAMLLLGATTAEGGKR